MASKEQAILEALEISKEEMIEKIVDRAVTRLFTSTSVDEDGDAYDCSSAFKTTLDKYIKDRIQAEIEKIGEIHVAPKLHELIEGVTFQETNKWGEPKKEPLTLKEYLIGAAERYMTEEVDFKGKTREQDSYNWSRYGTRISYMINEYLGFHIEKMMKESLETANKALVGGLEKACKIQLEDLSKKIKVAVSTGR